MPDRLEIEILVGGLSAASNQLTALAQSAAKAAGLPTSGVTSAGAQLANVAGGALSLGAGGGATGIVRVAGAMAQLAKVAGPAVIALGAFATAVGVIYAAGERASRSLMEFGQLQASLAATPGETGALRTLGRTFGFDPLAAAQGARSAQTSNPLAAAAGARLGIPFQPYDISSRLDLGKFLIDIIKGGIEEAKTNRAQAEADISNLLGPQMTFVLRGHGEILRLLERENQMMKQVHSDENQAKAISLSIAQNELAMQWELLSTSIGLKFLPALTAVVTLMNHMPNPISQLFDPTYGARGIIDWIREAFGGRGHETAQERLAKALDNNTASVRDLGRGIYGGGGRARGAIPRQFQGAGAQLRSVYNADSARLGAYSVGL